MTEKTHGTGIEWTHVPGYKGETWNPVRGCVKISPGCKHCYAEAFAERWRGVVIQCKEQGVPVFLKQLGAAPVRSFGDMPIKIRLKSKKGSDEAEWPSHLRGLKRFPQIVRAA